MYKCDIYNPVYRAHTSWSSTCILSKYVELQQRKIYFIYVNKIV